MEYLSTILHYTVRLFAVRRVNVGAVVVQRLSLATILSSLWKILLE